jgi:aspartate aminotransferase
MYSLSHQISLIQPSPTLALNEKARQLRESGADIINLGIGEPLNKFPQSAFDLSLKKLETGLVKYGPVSGSPELKKAVQDYTRNYYGRTPELNNIIITSGAKQALYNLFQVILNPGEEVILLAPYWVSYSEMVKLARGIPQVVMPEENFIPDIDAIKNSITAKTRALILNSPSNPSGVVYPAELVAALVDLCETKKIFLIMDDIYHQLVFEPYQWVPGYVFTSKPIDKSYLVIVNGIAKTYGMTGFRVGWAVGPETVIQAMTTIQSHSTSNVSGLLQDAALGALQGGEQTLVELKESIRVNRDILLAGLASIPGVRTVEPGGTFYCFPDFQDRFPDSQSLAALLLEKAFVATVPGIAFGMDGYLRLSYACPKDQAVEAAARISWALDPSAPKEIIIGGKPFLRDWELKA